jgi:hypothetical protein
MKKQRLIVVALVVCATIVLVAVAITRHVNNKQDAAVLRSRIRELCHPRWVLRRSRGKTHKSGPPVAPKKWPSSPSAITRASSIAERAWHQFLEHGGPMPGPGDAASTKASLVGPKCKSPQHCNAASGFHCASWAMSRTRALMFRLNCRLGSVRGSRGLCSAQIGSKGRAPHIRFVRGLGADHRRVRWIFDSP